ncbi:PhnE/PtxC family ABC transporter permease [Paenibacillus periandrae]|uniref:PhnE/PtxC family ABC transporter permease n=1 Tax=Paenibacillus periandrae TaxID=1761741 RepID=UPI001F09AF12
MKADEKPIKIKPFNKADVITKSTILILVLLTIYTFLTLNYQNLNLQKSIPETLHNFKVFFFEPQLNHFEFMDIVNSIIATLGLSVLTTVFGGIVALIFGLFAAENLSSKTASNLIKAIVAMIRAVPTIFWVLIFSASIGLGSTSAVIGMSFHTIGYLMKAYSESFEELDKSVIEALKSSGASWWQIVIHAVIPSSMTFLISWTFIRFEINFATAVAVSAAAGAEGIGFNLFQAASFYYDLHEAGMITYFILFVAFVFEYSSTRVKRKLKDHH